MKRNLKRSFILLVVVLLSFAVVFSGCQKKEEAKGAKEEPQKEVVLNWPCIWVGEDAKADAVADIVAEFNEKHAGQIKVEIEEMPSYDIYDKKILAQISGGEVPDIFTLKWNPDTKDFYSGDILVDFSEDLAGGWGNRFDSSIVNEVTLDGQTKVIPYEMAITPIWYNADLFEEAGIDGFPETYDEFWDACEKLKAIDVTPTSQMTGGPTRGQVCCGTPTSWQA